MKKLFSILIIGLVLNVILLIPLFAFAQTNAADRLAAKNKAKVEKLGTGSTGFIQLQYKEKFKGKIIQINSDNFVV